MAESSAATNSKEVVQIGFLINIRIPSKHTSCITIRLAKPRIKKHRIGLANNNTIKGSPQKDVGLDAQKARALYYWALYGIYMNSELAEKTSLLALKVSAELNKHLHKIKDECSSEEFSSFRESTAKIMGELQFGFMNPIYEEYPDLKPKELGGAYDIDPNIYT